MFAIPKKTDYALIALHHLMARPEETSSAREMAEMYNMPCALLMNILKDLQQAGLVSSTRGAKGGYQLCVDPAETSLYDVLLATSGEVALTECCGGAGQHTCNVARPTVVEAPEAEMEADGGGGSREVSGDSIHRATPGKGWGVELRISGCPIREPLKLLHLRLVQFLQDVKLSDLLRPARAVAEVPTALTSSSRLSLAVS